MRLSNSEALRSSHGLRNASSVRLSVCYPVEIKTFYWSNSKKKSLNYIDKGRIHHFQIYFEFKMTFPRISRQLAHDGDKFDRLNHRSFYPKQISLVMISVSG